MAEGPAEGIATGAPMTDPKPQPPEERTLGTGSANDGVSPQVPPPAGGWGFGCVICTGPATRQFERTDWFCAEHDPGDYEMRPKTGEPVPAPERETEPMEKMLEVLEEHLATLPIEEANRRLDAGLAKCREILAKQETRDIVQTINKRWPFCGMPSHMNAAQKSYQAMAREDIEAVLLPFVERMRARDFAEGLQQGKREELEEAAKAMLARKIVLQSVMTDDRLLTSEVYSRLAEVQLAEEAIRSLQPPAEKGEK